VWQSRGNFESLAGARFFFSRRAVEAVGVDAASWTLEHKNWCVDFAQILRVDMTQHLPPIGAGGAPRSSLPTAEAASLPILEVEREIGGVSFLLRLEQNVYDVLIVAKHLTGQGKDCSISVPLTQERVSELNLDDREALYLDLVAKLRVNSTSGEKVKRRLFFTGNPLPQKPLARNSESPRTVEWCGSVSDESSTSSGCSPLRRLGELRDPRCSLDSLEDLSLSAGDTGRSLYEAGPTSTGAELPPLDLSKARSRVPFAAPGAAPPLRACHSPHGARPGASTSQLTTQHAAPDPNRIEHAAEEEEEEGEEHTSNGKVTPEEASPPDWKHTELTGSIQQLAVC